MTTYTINGIGVFRDPETDTVTMVDADTPLRVVMPQGASSLRYTLDPLPPGGTAEDQTVSIDVDPLAATIDGFDISDQGTSDSIFAVDWLDGGVPRTTIVLVLFFETPPFGVGEVDFIFPIGGDATPPITNPAQWAAFESQITGIGTPGAPFAPNTDIPFALISDSSTENDIVPGTNADDFFDVGAGADVVNGLGGDDILLGGTGNDILRGNGGNDQLDGGDGNDRLFGNNGEDILIGGDGNDFISTGENGVGSFDYISAGVGFDRVILSGIVEGFAQFDHRDLDARVVMTIDGDANSAVIGKGTNGTTRITDVANPLQGDGLGLIGTDFDDIITVAAGTDGWMQIRGHSGNDRIKINPSDGFVRLDYRDDAATSGITANLDSGQITNDGFGDTDRIFGSGKVNELRATMMDDTIIGTSGDDRFILMAGTDSLNAGGGTDLVRYDRNGVDAVTVDLVTDIATGTWLGQSFTHTLTNVEDLRGSREGNDMLSGSAGVNHIDGRGGDDTLLGLAGDDTLVGDAGDDTLIGGRGADALIGGDGTDTASYSDAATKLRADLFDDARNTGWALGDLFFDIENLEGGALNDRLSGNGRANRLEGGDGNDTLEGRAGADTLLGENGDDRLFGGGGNDEMTGGGGDDQFSFNLGADVITDFETGDTLRLDDGLWSGTLSNAQILDFADVIGGDTVFDFGGGNTLTLEDWTDTAALEAVISTF